MQQHRPKLKKQGVGENENYTAFQYSFHSQLFKSMQGHKLENLRASPMNDFNLCYDKKFMTNYGYPLHIL